jgi:hypothetical protein
LITEGHRQLTLSPAAKGGREVRGGCHLPDHQRTPVTNTVAGGEVEKKAMVWRGGRGGRRPTPSPAAMREGRGRRDGEVERVGWEEGDRGDGDLEAAGWRLGSGRSMQGERNHVHPPPAHAREAHS